MAYDKTADLKQIQADVLTEDTSTNTLIKKLNQFKTNGKTVVKAVNEIKSSVNTALSSANNASKSIAQIQENIPNIVKEQAASIASNGIQDDEFACSENQTVFKLSKTPADAANVLFYINGIKEAHKDYIYDEASNTVSWVGFKTAQNPKGFFLDVKDVVSIVYTRK